MRRRLTGVGVVESVPDEFVRGGEVFVVPMAVDALRRRIMAGKVYSADRVGGALAEYFQASNLEALNELCGAWVADNVDEVGSELLFVAAWPAARSSSPVSLVRSAANW